MEQRKWHILDFGITSHLVRTQFTLCDIRGQGLPIENKPHWKVVCGIAPESKEDSHMFPATLADLYLPGHANK